MSNSKYDMLSVAGALGAGLAGLYMLRRATRARRDEEHEIPSLRLPAGCWHPIQAIYHLGKDSFNYGSGRWILQECDPNDGIALTSFLGQETVMLRDPDLVQEVIQKNHQAGFGYGKSFKGSPFDPMIDRIFGRGLFFAEDQDAQWAIAHKVLSKPFSHRGILGMVPLMCEQADKLLAALERDTCDGEAVFLYDYMVKMALETVAVCSMGTHFDCFSSQEPHPFPAAFNATIDAMFSLLNVPPALWWLCIRTKSKLQREVTKINAVIEEIIARRIRKETCASGKSPDLLDIMLQKSSGLSTDNVRSQILTFLFAGHDSTAAAMSSLITLLVANPRVEEKVVEEVQRVVGDGEVQAEHLSQLKYLDNCLKETLRVLPPAGNYQRMSFRDDLLLGGKWKVKKWTPISIDIFALHMDPETWGPDAADFIPERWEAGAPHQFSYMPFAAGPRGCIGKEFSLVEQKIVAAKLLQKFAVRCPETWAPRPGSILITDSELAQPKLGIDAEFNPLQFFVGASIPVKLQPRSLPRSQGTSYPASQGGA